ncbi:MAG: 3-deoxy-8-phosphooctulonate synthase [Elusimicrobiaceae bacterium]|nr:3-deoxy-8-phosphooctulonate synthase [Elusimicrobiaceae bacterium]
MKQTTVKIRDIEIGNRTELAFIAGNCIIENEEIVFETARTLKRLLKGKKFLFKASFDKANRTSVTAYRGPGLKEGLRILGALKSELRLPLVIDVHEPCQAEAVAEVADMLQIPAFLCRQTDLVIACARTGRAVNIKKGQFLSPWDTVNIVKKAHSAGNRRILLTERGNSFGYGNLVVDMRGLEIMKNETGCPVIFDCTHSVQKPGGLGHATGGDAALAPALARAAAAVGIAGLFFETHPEPAKALSDGPNSLALRDVSKLVNIISAIDELTKRIAK